MPDAKTADFNFGKPDTGVDVKTLSAPRLFRCDKCGAQVEADWDAAGTKHRFEGSPPSVKRIDYDGVVQSRDDPAWKLTHVECGTWVAWDSEKGCSADGVPHDDECKKDPKERGKT